MSSTTIQFIDNDQRINWCDKSIRIDIEWIEERSSEPRVHAQVEVKELADRVWSIGAPRFIVRKGECRLRFVATNSYTLEERVFEAILGANGKYTTVRWEKKAA